MPAIYKQRHSITQNVRVTSLACCQAIYTINLLSAVRVGGVYYTKFRLRNRLRPLPQQSAKLTTEAELRDFVAVDGRLAAAAAAAAG